MQNVGIEGNQTSSIKLNKNPILKSCQKLLKEKNLKYSCVVNKIKSITSSNIMERDIKSPKLTQNSNTLTSFFKNISDKFMINNNFDTELKSSNVLTSSNNLFKINKSNLNEDKIANKTRSNFSPKLKTNMGINEIALLKLESNSELNNNLLPCIIDTKEALSNHNLNENVRKNIQNLKFNSNYNWMSNEDNSNRSKNNYFTTEKNTFIFGNKFEEILKKKKFQSIENIQSQSPNSIIQSPSSTLQSPSSTIQSPSSTIEATPQYYDHRNLGNSEKKSLILKKLRSSFTKTNSETVNIPNLIKSFSVKSKEGKNVKNIKKINQDNYLIMNSILELLNYSIFSIFDGHGINGHYISEYLKNYLYKYFRRSELFHIPRFSSIKVGLPSLKNLSNENEVYKKIVENDYKLIRTAFKSVETEVQNSNYELNFSGSTACCVFIVAEKLICANIGDSRGILVCDDQIIQISRDHKPENEGEKERIIKKGGEIHKKTEFGYKLGPYRVWVKDESYPGLAMSRSIGDFVAKSIGVIADPEILEYPISNNCKFIVIASDGIWEHLSNNQVKSIVNKYYESNDIEGAIDKLIFNATSIYNQTDQYVDDITVIIIFF